MQEQQQQEQLSLLEQHLKWQSIKSAMGTLATEESLNLLAHLVTGNYGGMAETAIFGGIAAFVAGYHGPKALHYLREIMPGEELEPFQLLTRREPGKRSIVDKLLDRHPETGEQIVEVEPLQIEPGGVLETTAREATEMQQGPDQVGQEGDRSLMIPHAPKFKEMSHLLGSDRLILCYTIDGPLYGTVIDLLSMAIVGKPGRGKTTALMYYVSMLLKNGAEVFIWDPHGTMGELALLNGKTLSDMPATAKVVYLDRKDDMVDSVVVLQQKLQERDEEYRKCVRVGKPFIKHPLLLLSDELPVLADYDEQVEAQYKKLNRERKSNEEDELEVPSLITVIRRIVLEARKWNCYFIGSGQSTDAQILPTRVTENLSSRIVFYSSDRRARMAGLEQEDVKKFLPILKRSDPGTMVFDGSRFDAPMLGAIPEINAADMKEFLLGKNIQEQASPLIKNVTQPMSSGGLTIDRILALYAADKLSEAAMLKLIDRLPVVQNAADDEEDDPRETSHLRLVSKEAVEDDYHAQETERLPETPASTANTGRFTKSLSPELQRAYEAYQQGNIHCRELGAALGINKDKAAVLIRQLKDHRLIAG